MGNLSLKLWKPHEYYLSPLCMTLLKYLTMENLFMSFFVKIEFIEISFKFILNPVCMKLEP